MFSPSDSFSGALQQKGVNRRRFLKFCSLMTATLALPPRYVAQVAAALEKARKPVLVWLQFQDCAGNSESILRSSHPTVLEVVLDLFSWEYHELIMAGAGHQAEAALERVVREEKGKFLAVVEGAIPLADDGVYCTVGGRTALDIARHVCPNAAATIAAGACAWDGGLVRGPPQSHRRRRDLGSRARGQRDQSRRLPAESSEHRGRAGALPDFRRVARRGPISTGPCSRMDGSSMTNASVAPTTTPVGTSRNGVTKAIARAGACTKWAAKAPQATFNCPSVRWNDGTSWPVKAGHGCLACASHRFWDTRSPFYERLPQVPGFGVDVTAGQIGLGVTAAVAGATIVHGIASAVRDRMRTRPGAVPPQASNQPPKA